MPEEGTGKDIYKDGEITITATTYATVYTPSSEGNGAAVTTTDIPGYNVWVGGRQITTINAADVFGDGKVSYDDATKTLTLNGYTYSGAGYQSSAIYATEDIAIVVQGENSLTSTAGYGIYAGGTIAVTGAGVDPALNITASTNVLVVGETAAFTNLALAASGVRGIVLNGSDAADAVILNGCTATFASGMNAAISVYNETGHGTVSIVNGSDVSGYGQILVYGKGSSYGDAALTVKDSVVELEVLDSAGTPRPGHCLEVLSYHGDASLLISNSTVTVNAKNNADAVNVGAQNTSNGKGKCKVDIIDSEVEGVGKRCGLTAFTWDDTGANVYGTSVNIINSEVSVEGQGDSGFNVYAYAKGCTSFYVTNSTVEATAPDTAINLRPGYYKDAALIGSITYTQIDSDVTATASDYYGLCVSTYSAGRGNYSATNSVTISGGSFTSYGMVCCENDAANSEIVVTDDAEVYVDVSTISYYYYTFDLSSILTIDSGKNAFAYKSGAGIAPSTVVGNITGGIFTEDVSDLCAVGYTVIANTDAATKDDYPYAVAPAVASITVDDDTTYYATFADAIAAADAAVAGGDPDPMIVVLDQTAEQTNPDWKFVTDDSVNPAVTTLVRKVYVAQIETPVTYTKLAANITEASDDVYLDMWTYWGMQGMKDANGNACPRYVSITDNSMYRDLAVEEGQPEDWVSAKYIYDNYFAPGKSKNNKQTTYFYNGTAATVRKYETLPGALTDVQANQKITLLANVTDGGVLPYAATLDKAGFTCGALTAPEHYAVVNFSGNTDLYRTFMDNWERPDYADLSWYTANPSADSFEIASAAQFAGFAQLVNGKAFNADGTPCYAPIYGSYAFRNKTITLTADIDLTAHGWVPVGFDPFTQANADYTSTYYRGTFDGGNHTITYALTEQNSIYDYDALFGGLYYTTIKNLKLNVAISYPGDIAAGYWNADVYGGACALASYVANSVVISNVTMNGTATFGTYGSSGGGLVFAASGGAQFYDCVNNATVNIKQYYRQGTDGYFIWGGIACQTTGTSSSPVPCAKFVRCVNNATVTVENPYDNDRLIGRSETGYGSMNRLADMGKTTFYSRKLNAGGIVGQVSNTGYLVYAVDCENNGTIVGCHTEKFDADGHYASLHQKGSFCGKEYVGGSSTPTDYTIVVSDASNKVFYTSDNTYWFLNVADVDLSACTLKGEGSYYRSSNKIYQKVGGAAVEVTDAETIELLNEGKRLVGPVVSSSRVVLQTTHGPYVAQVISADGTTTNKFDSLAKAFAAVPTDGSTMTIQMITNSVETVVSTNAATMNVILDLNGWTVSHAGVSTLITNFGTLTIQDSSENKTGLLQLTSGVGAQSMTVYNLGGTLTLASGKIENTSGGLAYAVNNAVNWGHVSTFNMTGGTLSAPNGDADLRVYNNTSFSVTADCKNYVNISGGTLASNGIFVDTYLGGTYSASFTGDNLANEINISGGTINGLIDLKIRHPFNTALNITGGDFTNAKMWVRKYSSEYNASLAEPTASMVYISGGKFAFVAGKAFGLSYDCGATSWTTYAKPYAVSGGVFNLEVPAFACAEGYIPVDNTDAETSAAYPYTVAGAVAKIEDTYYLTFAEAIAAADAALADTGTDPVIIVLNAEAEQTNSDWKFVTDDSEPPVTTLVRKVYVAQIGEAKYESMAEAFAAAQSGDTIQMTADSAETVGSTLASGKSVVLDLNGKAVSYTSAFPAAFNLIAVNGTLTVTDTSADADGSIALTSTANLSWDYAVNMFIVGNGGSLTIEKGSYSVTTPSYGYAEYVIAASNNNGASTVVVNGGTFTGNNIDAVVRLHDQRGRSQPLNVTVNGGDFTLNGSQCDSVIWFDVQNSNNGTDNASVANLVINGGTFTSTSASPALDIGHSVDASGLRVTVAGGAFKSNGAVIKTRKLSAAAIANIQLSGGIYSGNEYYNDLTKETASLGGLCADGYIVTDNTDDETKTAYPYTVAFAGDIIYPIEGTAGVPIALAWATNNTSVVSEGAPVTAADVPNIITALGENGANNMPKWESYVLGLNPADPTAVLRLAATAKNATTVTITGAIDTTKFPSIANVTVTFRLAAQNGAEWTDIATGATTPSFDVALDDVAGKVLAIFADIVTE